MKVHFFSCFCSIKCVLLFSMGIYRSTVYDVCVCCRHVVKWKFDTCFFRPVLSNLKYSKHRINPYQKYCHLKTSIISDTDECELETDNCKALNAICVNTDGNFYCNCSEGYEKSSTGHCIGMRFLPDRHSSDRQCLSCFYIDINECKNDTLNDCAEDAICNNVVGSYMCMCKKGYTGEGNKACNGKYIIQFFVIKLLLNLTHSLISQISMNANLA